ncbi:MAG: class I SAM-dependent methyltransferase [Firmicutes bacterium]|nr:class I SAM-dependent methyltransferase [Bacillota bacterium]
MSAEREADLIPGGDAKERFVRRLFAAIAPTYDIMNVVMSAGCICLWHRAFRRHTGLGAGDRALDVCTGTGELARIMARQVGPGGQVVGLDLTPEMLEIARRKLAAAGLDRVVTLVEGNALRLPFPDASFKAASIGFALRNVADIGRVIGEMARVVEPGGRVLSLELSRPPSRLVRAPYFFYFYRVVPLLGRLVDRSAGQVGPMRPYTYLPASLVKFPDQETVARIFREAGLVNVRYYGLTGGIVTLHVGERPA